MNIASLSCIHGDIENLLRFLDKLSLLDIDIIILPGDFTDFDIPKGFSRLDVAKIVVEEIRGLKKPVVAVPGSWDKEIIDYFEREGISVHGRGKIINGVGFYGYGGAKTPFKTPFEPSENEILVGLENGYEEIKDFHVKIQVTHAPPYNTKLDVISSGAHVGSETVRKFIEEKQPAVAVSAHIHESRGVDTLGATKLLNSGRFSEGHFGIISIIGSQITVKVGSLI